MTVYWDNATLGPVRIEFDILADDGSAERVRTTAHIPHDDEHVNVRMEYKNHAFLFQDKALIGVRNGTPAYIDPADDRELTRCVDELVDTIVANCNSSAAYKRGELPEGLIEVLRQGADIEPYVRMDDLDHRIA